MTTSTLSPVATVSAVYEAFGRGDIATILGFLADDVSWDADWVDNYAQRTTLDHFTPRRGHAGATEFFGAIQHYTVHDLEVHDLIGNDRRVVAVVTIDISTPARGRARDEELHLWSFGQDGKVAALRHYIDTAKHLAADKGTDTTVP